MPLINYPSWYVAVGGCLWLKSNTTLPARSPALLPAYHYYTSRLSHIFASSLL